MLPISTGFRTIRQEQPIQVPEPGRKGSPPNTLRRTPTLGRVNSFQKGNFDNVRVLTSAQIMQSLGAKNTCPAALVELHGERPVAHPAPQFNGLGGSRVPSEMHFNHLRGREPDHAPLKKTPT